MATFIVAGVLLAFPALASAHIGLLSPESRYGPSVLKAAPCGMAGGQRTTDKVYEVKSGATITVMWDEYINHPSHYRISFDDNGDDDFHEPTYNGPTATIDPSGFTPYEYPTTLVDFIADMQGGTYTQQVTLPDIECDNCTLQLIQVMYDKPPYDCDTNPSCNDVYHQCVDLVLSANGPDTPTLIGPAAPNSGGCSAAGAAGRGAGGGAELAWLTVAFLALWWRRARTRRRCPRCQPS